jgi:hypothetical protein
MRTLIIACTFVVIDAKLNADIACTLVIIAA